LAGSVQELRVVLMRSVYVIIGRLLGIYLNYCAILSRLMWLRRIGCFIVLL
jgi:hypothetical protein